MKTLVISLGLAATGAAAAPVHVEMVSRPNGIDQTWTLRGINSRKLLCPDTASYARECVVNHVIAPRDCDWECQEGVLSGQGRSVFLGDFAPAEAGQPRVFKIEAAWDTWQNEPIRGPLYRVTRNGSTYSLEQLERQKKPKTFKKLDWTQAEDTNFQMDPAKADELLDSPLGLRVTGQWHGTTFKVDQVWRQWSPRLTCDVWAIAKARALPEGTDAVTMIFGSEEEATTYKDPEGRTVRWLMWQSEGATDVVFRSGINDLWSEVFSVARKGCAVTVLAEH